jgi:hypothetical protein
VEDVLYDCGVDVSFDGPIISSLSFSFYPLGE